MPLTSFAKPLGWFSLALGAAELLALRKNAAARKAPPGKRKMAIASLVTVVGFLALDLLVARANARA